MVYCGKPSKGCSNCRERKIRVSPLFELPCRVPSESVSIARLRSAPRRAGAGLRDDLPLLTIPQEDKALTDADRPLVRSTRARLWAM